MEESLHGSSRSNSLQKTGEEINSSDLWLLYDCLLSFMHLFLTLQDLFTEWVFFERIYGFNQFKKGYSYFIH
jgi:hypothetical protein